MRAVLALLLVAYCQPARAAMACAPHDELIALLKEKYQEVVVSRGDVRMPGGAIIIGIMETTASPAGTWTMILTDPRNLACIQAAGANFGQAKLKPAKPAKPAGNDA